MPPALSSAAPRSNSAAIIDQQPHSAKRHVARRHVLTPVLQTVKQATFSTIMVVSSGPEPGGTNRTQNSTTLLLYCRARDGPDAPGEHSGCQCNVLTRGGDLARGPHGAGEGRSRRGATGSCLASRNCYIKRILALIVKPGPLFPNHSLLTVAQINDPNPTPRHHHGTPIHLHTTASACPAVHDGSSGSGRSARQPSSQAAEPKYVLACRSLHCPHSSVVVEC